MIDIENEIFTRVSDGLTDKFKDISVSGAYSNRPASFPHVSLIEWDNYMPLEYADTSDAESFANVMYEVNVYSNKITASKAECRAIMTKIDSIMYGLNFVRTACTPVPNAENASIYRLTARYSAVTDGKNIYRR